MKAMMMTCGHAANATSEGKPSCVICGVTESATLEIGERMAKCQCGQIEKSDPERLAFFEWRGPGSPRATMECRKCHYFDTAHDPEAMRKTVSRTTVVERGKCDGFEPLSEGHEFDSFYCGCRGWD